MSSKTPCGPKASEGAPTPGMDTLLEAGALLLASGAETYRVETTLRHMGRALGYGVVEIFATPTGIMLSVPGEGMGLRRIHERRTRMDVIAEVNDLSRALDRDARTPLEVLGDLRAIAAMPAPFRERTHILAGAATSAGFAFLVGGRISEGLAAALIGAVMAAVRGGLGFALADRFLTAAMGGFLAGFAGAALALLGLREAVLIPSSLLLLVPGLQVTNAVRDVLSGDLLSGAALALEAVVLAFALAGGVGLGIGAFRLLSP